MAAGWQAFVLPAATIAGAVLAYLAMWGMVRRSADWQQAASSFSALLTGAAILVAGYWYLVERKGAPHADLDQSVAVVALGNGLAAVETTLGIKNLGSTLLEIRRFDLRLQSVSPAGLPLDQVAAAAPTVWPATFADGRTPMYAGTELQWRTIRYFAGAVQSDIEPGETDHITSTFIVPCTLKRVRIASEVTKAGAEQLTWKIRTFASTEDACGKD